MIFTNCHFEDPDSYRGTEKSPNKEAAPPAYVVILNGKRLALQEASEESPPKEADPFAALFFEAIS